MAAGRSGRAGDDAGSNREREFTDCDAALQQQQQVCFGEFGQNLTYRYDCCSVQAFEGIGGIKEFYLFLVDSQ